MLQRGISHDIQCKTKNNIIDSLHLIRNIIYLFHPTIYFGFGLLSVTYILLRIYVKRMVLVQKVDNYSGETERFYYINNVRRTEMNALVKRLQ